MQDRTRETYGLGDRRIGVQWIGIGAEPIDQRRLRPRRQVAGQFGRALWDRMHRKLLARRAAEAAVATAERGLQDGGDALAGRLVVDHPLGIDDRALARALIDDLGDAGAVEDGAARRKWPVQF